MLRCHHWDEAIELAKEQPASVRMQQRPAQVEISSASGSHLGGFVFCVKPQLRATVVPNLLREMMASGALETRLEAVCELLPLSFGLPNLLALLSDIYAELGASDAHAGGIAPVRSRDGGEKGTKMASAPALSI